MSCLLPKDIIDKFLMYLYQPRFLETHTGNECISDIISRIIVYHNKDCTIKNCNVCIYPKCPIRKVHFNLSIKVQITTATYVIFIYFFP